MFFFRRSCSSDFSRACQGSHVLLVFVFVCLLFFFGWSSDLFYSALSENQFYTIGGLNFLCYACRNNVYTVIN